MQILKEESKAAHWYDPASKAPRHTVIGKTTGRPRPTTITDARANGWVPSVTSILKCLHKPALERWKIGQAVMACMTATRNEGEGIDAFIDRVLNQEEQHMQEAAAARDLGTEIHAALEGALNNEQVPEHLASYVAPAIATIRDLQKQHAMPNIETEQILFGNGYAGMTDLIISNDDHEIILDFKCTKSVPKKEPWQEHQIQTSAYAGTRQKAVVGTCNLYISTVQVGTCVLFSGKPWRPIFEDQFLPLLQYWRSVNSF